MSAYDKERNIFSRLASQKLPKTTSEEEQRLQERLYTNIEYACGRHDWYEQQIQKQFHLSLTIITALVTFAPILIDRVSSPIKAYEFLYAIAFLSLLISQITTLINHLLFQRRSYPYREIADVTNWHFTYNIRTDCTDNISNEYEKESQINIVLNNYKDYINKWIKTNSSQNNSLADDLQQLFILLMLQKFRATHLRELQTINLYGYIFSIAPLTGAILMNFGH